MAAVQIYSASAGSGKTFTLVKEYLKILFEKAHANNYRAFVNIMAITFTNKATDEMKRRIIEALKQIAGGEETDLLLALREELPGIKAFDQHAHQILLRLLRDFSNFNIQTIDSFFQDIIRSFARELKLPLNFEVELDRDKALEFAVDELIGKIGLDDNITTWLKEYAYTRMDDDKGWNFRSQITEISGELFDENLDLEALEPTASRIVDIKKRLSSIIVSFEKELVAAGKAILEDIDQRGIPREAYNKNWLRNIEKAAKAYRGTDFNISDTYKRELRHEKSPLKADSPKLFNIGANDYESQIYSDNTACLYRLLTEDSRMYFAAAEARNNIYALGVIHHLNQYLKKYRRERNILFIIDAARLLAGFISLNDMPFLFEKIGSRIEYFFIDEFQDTSTVQWQNMLPLIRNILATTGAETRVLLVGDAKQSIYRWRGGDYRLIIGKAADSIAPFETETVRLDVNYRSLPEIVNFNNRFFSSVKDMITRSANESLEKELGMAYEHVVQKCGRANENGRSGKVAVRLIEKKDREWKSGALQQLDIQIAQLTSNGYAYHDMAILAKTRKEGIEISRHLQRSGIEVLSLETLLLKFDPDVKLIIAALYYISDPEIPLHYVNLIWQYTRNKNIDDIPESGLLSDFHERTFITQWLPDLKQQTEELAHVSSFEVFERIVSLLEINETENLFAGHLRQILFDFFRRESPGLKDFLEWWEENKDKVSIALDSGEDKINILTVHKAKGLEFPVVLIPFCDWDFYLNMSKDILWLSNDELVDNTQLPYRATSKLGRSIFESALEEERKWRWMDSINVLYVAFTRAQEVLYISLPIEKKEKDFPKRAAKLMLQVFSDWGITIDQDGVVYDEGELNTTIKENGEDKSGQGNEPWCKSWRSGKIADLHLHAPFENRDTRIGKLVHHSLYYLNDPAEDLDTAITRAEQLDNYLPDEIKSAQQHLERIVSLPVFKEWIQNAKHIWNEQALWYKGKLIRPDKILQTENGFIVVDYKTGDKEAVHQKQVLTYVNAVSEIFPGQNVDGYILYSEDGSLEKVTAKLPS